MKNSFLLICFIILSLSNTNAQTWEELNEKVEQYYNEGYYNIAISFAKKALEQCEIEYGKEHLNYGTSINNLALLYEKMGRYGEALLLYREALETTEKILGKDHPEYGISLNNLALLYEKMGRNEEALSLYREALENTEKTLGKDHPEYDIRLNNLALLYEKMGRYEEALSLYREALEYTEKTLGKDSSEYGSRLNNLAGLYQAMGRYEEALPLTREALKYTEKNLGKDHSNYGALLSNLALLLDWSGSYYKEAGQYDKALSYYKEVLAVDTELSRKGDIALDLNNIGKVYYALEQYDKAIEHYNKALEINEELDRKSNIETNLNNIGIVYNALGKYDRAKEYLTKALTINRGLNRKSNEALIPDKELARNGGVEEILIAPEDPVPPSPPADKQVRKGGVAVDLNNIRSMYKVRGHYSNRIEHDKRAMTTKLVKSNLYIISIGIDEYNPNSLEYCVSDVKKATEFLNKQFEADSIIITEGQTKSVFGQVYIYTLFNRQATNSSIDSLFRIVSNQANPEDFFVLFFAGISYDLGQDDSNYQGIYFVPFIEGEIYHPSEISKENFKHIEDNSISIDQLKFSLELIQAKKQLIITEAGPSENFFKEFTTALIEKDQIIAQLTDKNRIILTTNGIGWDNAICQNGDSTNGGPLLNFIVNLPPEANIFQLFDDKDKEIVKYNIIKNEIDCSFQKNTLYSAIYFERDILEVIKEVGKNYSLSRGTELLDEKTDPKGIGPDSIKNYALIIGTDEYDEPIWSKLSNPVYDATTIAGKVKEIYSFETELLINPTREEILDALLKYSSIRFDSRSQLFIFIAGHGKYDKMVRGIIATKDSKNPEVDRFHDTYISHSKLRDIIDNFDCNHILVVLDVCFGGTFNQNLSSIIISEGDMDISADENNMDYYQDLEVSKPEFIKRKMGGKTRLYMTSGGKEYVPDGIPGRHSPFASKFIDALDRMGGEDKILTYGEIKSFIEKLSPRPRGGTFGSKSDGDFLFIAKKE